MKTEGNFKSRLSLLASSLLFTTVAVSLPHDPAWSKSETSKASIKTSKAAKSIAADAKLKAALDSLDKLAQKEIDDKAVPGLAIAVVSNDKLVYAKGFGVREVGKEEKIDADTVFQLASVSKPIASSVVAALVGEGKITWDSKIADLDPAFHMFEPWVTSQVTLRDMFAHRSGLPDHAGDLLEDLGANRTEVLHALRFQKPYSSFRSTYKYTNFGLTEAAVAAAKAYNLSWEEASEAKLYRPLGMNSTSSRYADFIAKPNKASGHCYVNNQWIHKEQREPDAQSPAGGVSSSVVDVAKWLRMQLAKGKFEGRQVVDNAALAETWHPTMLTQFNPFNQLPGFYGLGMNVSYDDRGRLRLNHSGGFAMGAATCITILPGEQLGIAVLSNGSPVGIPEALCQTFVDDALEGTPQHDWLTVFKKAFANPETMGLVEGKDYNKPAPSQTPPLANSFYIGSYANDFFGKLEITESNGKLVMQVGPRKMEFPLTHYDRDTFTYETTGENAIGKSGVIFASGSGMHARNVYVDHLNDCGEGTFDRAH